MIRSRTTNPILPAALLALFLLVVPGPGATVGAESLEDDTRVREEARAAILAASAAFSRAYVYGDMETLAGLYTEDAVLLPPGRVVRGREAIADYFAPSPGRRNLSHSMRPDDLRIHGDTAVDSGTWTNVWQVDGGEPRRAEERYLVVWRRGDDGRWRIEYDMWHRPQG